MKSLRAALVRFAGLFRRQQQEVEMTEELSAHLEALVDRNLAAGMSPADARHAALRTFGGVEQIKEHARAGRRLLWLENLVRDAAFAVRTLRKNPGFTSVVVLTLALGLGVNTALFTWFNAAAFRPLPVLNPDQLYTLGRLDDNGREKTASYADFIHYRDHQTVLAGLAASAGHAVTVVAADEATATTGQKPPTLRIETVSTNYFSVFGVPIALGRPLVAPDENSSGAEPVIVLSHRFWKNHFGGDPNVIGQTLRVRGLAAEVLTIVGVTGPEFHGTKPGALAGWVPASLRPGDTWRAGPKAANFKLTARLRPGVSREQAAEELQVIANEFQERPVNDARRNEAIVLTKASTYINLSAQNVTMLLPMFCMFGAVFIVSCANASNLILARMVTRQFEFAVRSALGATRQRLFTLLMAESLVLGALGGLVGWAVAAGLLQFVWPWVLDMMPGAREATAGLYLHADYRVFGFTLAVSTLAGAAGGLLPALHVTRRNVLAPLNREGSAFGRHFRLSRVRRFLAVAQLALSSALVFTAGLLVHRALRTQFQSVGFDKSRLVTLEVLAPRTYEPGQLDAARRQVLEQIRALPEVAAVSEMPRFPFGARNIKVSVPAAEAAEVRTLGALQTAVPAGYFATLQLPLIQGRSFFADETPNEAVVVISETAAREFFPNGDALSQRLEIPTHLLTESPTSVAAPANEASAPRTSLTVVGVVRDTRVHDPWSGDRPVIYLPLAPQTPAAPFLLIRTTHAASRSLTALRQVAREVTGLVPNVLTVDDLLAGAFVQYRVLAWVAGMLAGISLIVAVIGLYGVMSFTVNQRVKEIGIRIALGATPRRVASGIVLESLCLVTLGAAAGYGLSVLIAQIARRLLLGVSPFNPVACGAVALFLAAIGILACWMPARRASKVDPIVALRAE